MTLDLSSQSAITSALLEKDISIVFYLIDAFRAETQVRFIHGLAEVGRRRGVVTHFLHTSGAKLFSGFVGHPVDSGFSDANEGLFEMQKGGQSVFPVMKTVRYHVMFQGLRAEQDAGLIWIVLGTERKLRDHRDS
jgi:hypothetical protein